MGETMDKAAVGGRILTARKAMRFSQAEVADKAEITRSYLCDIEKGRASPSLRTVRRLATALDIEPRRLIDGEFERDLRDELHETRATIAMLSATLTRIDDALRQMQDA